jgi:hypothetical protein
MLALSRKMRGLCVKFLRDEIWGVNCITSATGTASPSVIVMKEPVTKEDSLKILWEFKCPIEPANRAGFQSGGNVIELQRRELFVSMAHTDGKVFIIALCKKISGGSVAEKWNANTEKWVPLKFVLGGYNYQPQSPRNYDLECGNKKIVVQFFRRYIPLCNRNKCRFPRSITFFRRFQSNNY